MLNGKKFCFIICTNNKVYEQECRRYIDNLNVPCGYELEFIAITDAISMTSGYNRAMRMSDAKYKIYLHQDVFVINKNILKNILEIFQDDKIGMIGMVGNIYFPKCGVQWYGERVGRIISRNYDTRLIDVGNRRVNNPYECVEAIDGLMMMTQYDIPWREDLFTRFDFYDSSQSREFIRAGFKVVVPYMDMPWVIHDDGVMNLKNYHEQRKIFLKEYLKDFEEKKVKAMKVQKKRILYYCWDEWTARDIVEVLDRKSFAVEIFKSPMSDKLNDATFKETLRQKLNESVYDYIFTFNFFPIISKVADECGIKYISWNYDTPCLTLYSEAIFNSCNYIFSFDKLEVHKLKSYGVKKIYHLPLAVNMVKLNELLSRDINDQYKYEVSFVGNLYNDEYNFYDQIRNMPEYLKGYFDGIINAQMDIYGYDFATELITDELYKNMASVVSFNLDKEFMLSEKDMFIQILQKKITSIERPELLFMLAECGFDVTHFDFKKDERLAKVKYGGYLGYDTEMPRVFRESKINLNMTIRSNRSGIPLRCMDVMGAGGFLVSNYQPELAEYFVDGEELAMYSSRAELLGKIQYYLNNDDERVKMIEKARSKIESEFTYDIAVEKIFEIVK